MSTDKVLDVITEITPSVSNIIENEKINEILMDKIGVLSDDSKETVKKKGITKGISNLAKIIPIVLKEHREDIYHILSVVNDKPMEEIKKQNVLLTIKQINELLSDEGIAQVFHMSNS